MAQTITLKNPLFTFEPVTPTQIYLTADRNIAAGVNGANGYQFPRIGPALVVAFVKIKAIGTALSVCWRIADTQAETGNFCNSTNLVDAGTLIVPVHTQFNLFSDRTDAQYTGLWDFGTLTGTYTVDMRVEYYPVQ